MDCAKMTRLWFSYSFPDTLTLDSPEPANSPYSLSWNVGNFLKARAAECELSFQYINLDDTTPYSFDEKDIVVGHVWDTPSSFMQQALTQHICPVFVLQPYTHHMVSENDVPRYLSYFERSTHLFWITGRTWFDTMNESRFASLKHKSTRLDMAIDSKTLHPYSKQTWNPPGKRAALCIGNDTPAQNWAEVAELARTSGLKLGYCGNADAAIFKHVANFKHFGGVTFDPQTIAAMCKEYDALICLHRESANPTVLLEAVAWGLQAYCTETSGYYANEPFMELRLDDFAFNWDQIVCLQSVPEAWLRARSQATRILVEQAYNWDIFCDTLWRGIEQCL
jgi:hypothetical protein